MGNFVSDLCPQIDAYKGQLSFDKGICVIFGGGHKSDTFRGISGLDPTLTFALRPTSASLFNDYSSRFQFRIRTQIELKYHWASTFVEAINEPEFAKKYRFPTWLQS
jgi:hypothetical protein